MKDDDPFAELAPLDLDELTAQRMRRRAHAELARAVGPAWRRTARRAWRRSELLLAAAVSLVYLGLALERMTMLYR
jgi:hypothetical protein